jgi:hypothetical protein
MKIETPRTTNPFSRCLLIGTLLCIGIFWAFLFSALFSVFSIFLSLPPNVQYLDFAGGTVVHTGSASSVLYFAPMVSFLFLFWYDRPSLSTRLGRVAWIAGLTYYLFSACVLALLIFVSQHS